MSEIAASCIPLQKPLERMKFGRALARVQSGQSLKEFSTQVAVKDEVILV